MLIRTLEWNKVKMNDKRLIQMQHLNWAHKVVIFDLDNTLIECGQHYLDAQDEFVRQVTARTGLDGDLVLKVLQKIDVECSSLPDGFSRYRFPRSFKAAALALDAIASIAPSMEFADSMYAVGDAVFTAEYPIYPGVRELLMELRLSGYRLGLITKGDPQVQNWKIDKHDLRPYFEHVNVVLNKNPDVFAGMVELFDVPAASVWVVGDSLKDDIGPAKHIGCRTIEINSKTGRWGYENESHAADFRVFHVVEARPYLLTHPKLIREYAKS